MLWNDPPAGELAQQATTNALAHPTNSAFSELAWANALVGLADITERDIQLCIAAVFFGSELAALRNHAVPQTVTGLSRAALVRLLAAFANQQFSTLQVKVRQKLKQYKASRFFDMEEALKSTIEGAGGQEMSPDDLLTYMVDSLPHWLFHIWQVSEDTASSELDSAIDYAATAFRIFSIEHSLRSLWQEALWLGLKLDKDGQTIVSKPWDRALSGFWLVWNHRDQQNMTAELSLEAGAHIVSGGKLPPVVPVNRKTVIRFARPPSGRRVLVLGNSSGAKYNQRHHVTEQAILDRMYTGLFMDELLPKSPTKDFTCRELCHAWWLLKDIGELALSHLGRAWWDSDADVERFSLLFERGELAKAFEDCLNITPERAEALLGWFICDPSNVRRLFSKSVWSEPLLPKPDSNAVHLILAPLIDGSPVKRVEAWMERGGISDTNGLKGRGKPYERFVRQTLSEALSSNRLFTDTSICAHGIKKRADGEEIDLLIRIGTLVFVGEIKCFVAPSEPLERLNHLKNVSKAAAQAARKADWARSNLGLIASALDINERCLDGAQFVPLVVLNSGFGMGLERDGAPIVDLHYFRNLLSEGSYQGDTRFELNVGMSFDPVVLYTSQSDFEKKAVSLLKDPFPIKRLRELLGRRLIPFQTIQGSPFFIELAELRQDSEPNYLRDLPPFKRTRSRKR